jgi:hypothetical protein
MRLLITLLALLSCLAAAQDPKSLPPEQAPAASPIEHWEGIPLPPGTKLYRKAGFSMVASVVMPFSDVERWYQSTMMGDGWESTVVSRSEKGWLGGAVVVLQFKRGKALKQTRTLDC